MTELTVTIQESDRKRSWTWRDTVYRRGYAQTVYRMNRRASDRPDGHSIVYLDIEGESVLENLENRRTRPHTALRPLVAQALRDAGVSFTGLRWSQRAGCSCPCSPGWILQGSVGKDYWATVSAADVATLVAP